MALSSWKEGLLSMSTRPTKDYDVLENVIFGVDGSKGAKIRYPPELQAEVDILEEEIKIKHKQLALYKEEFATKSGGLRREISRLRKEMKELRKIHALKINDMVERPHPHIVETTEYRLALHGLNNTNRSKFVERRANVSALHADKYLYLENKYQEKLKEMGNVLNSMHEFYMDRCMNAKFKETIRKSLLLEAEYYNMLRQLDTGKMMKKKYNGMIRYLKGDANLYHKTQKGVEKKVAQQRVELDMMRDTWEEIAYMNQDLKYLSREERALLSDRRDRILYRKGMALELQGVKAGNFRICRHMKPPALIKRTKKVPRPPNAFDRAFEEMERKLEHLKDIMQCLDFEDLPVRVRELQRVNKLLKDRANLEMDQVLRLEGLRNKVRKIVNAITNRGVHRAKKFVVFRLMVEKYLMANRRRTKKYSRTVKLALKASCRITFGVWVLIDIMDFVKIPEEPEDAEPENCDDMMMKLARSKLLKLTKYMEGHNVSEDLSAAIKRHQSELPDGLCLYPITCIPVELDDELELTFDEDDDADDEDVYNREDVKMYSRLLYIRKTARPGFFEQFQKQ